jgi:hypothetical protein
VSKFPELLFEGGAVIRLCVGVAQLLQLDGCLFVSRSHFLIHKRVQARPYGVSSSLDGGERRST